MNLEDPNIWQALLPSLAGALIGAGAALGGIWVSDGLRRKARYGEAAALLVAKVNANLNGVWGVNSYIKSNLARAGEAPPEDWWKYVQETVGFLPPPEPLGGSELELLIAHKKGELFTKLTEIENANRILFESMRRYSALRRQLHEIAAPFTEWKRTETGMVASTNLDPKEVPMATPLAYDCETLIIQNLQMTEEVMVQIKSAVNELNGLMRRHKGSWGLGMRIDLPS